MQVTEFDPRQADDDDMSQWRDVLNAMTEVDMPGEPRWRDDRLRDYLTVTMPGEHRFMFVARDDARIIGHGNLLLLGDDFADVGVFEIFVHPDARGRGVGRTLLQEIGRRAAVEGRGTIGVEVIASTPAVDFYDRLGFSRAVVENRHLLKMDDVDWDAIVTSAGRVAAGYRLEYYQDDLPDGLLERYAAVKATLKAEPAVNASAWRGSADVERLRDSLGTLRARGMRPHLVVAISESSGAVVGLTELVVAAQRPTRGDQYDTVVAPEHRSYGLGLAMKARMLTEIRETEPQLVDVQTWTSLDGDPNEHVDAALGFRHDVQWYEYESIVSDILYRLS